MFDVNWMGGGVRCLDGVAVAPLLHIINIATFPMVADQTYELRRAFPQILPDCELFNQNMVMASVLKGKGDWPSIPGSVPSTLRMRSRPAESWSVIMTSGGGNGVCWPGFLKVSCPGVLPKKWEQPFRNAVEWDFRYEPSAPAQLCDDMRRRLGYYAGGDACSEGYDHRNHTPGSETPVPAMGHCRVDSHQATQAENQEGDAPRDSENHQRDARLIRQERSRALQESSSLSMALKVLCQELCQGQACVKLRQACTEY